MDDDDNDFGGGGDDWDGPTGDPPGQEEAAPGVAAPVSVQAGTGGPGMQTRGAMQNGAPLQAEEEDEIDPWKPLDPHDPGTAVVRPYKRGESLGYPSHAKSADKLIDWFLDSMRTDSSIERVAFACSW